MGPVSFEPVDVPGDRADVMALSGRLTAAGVRVISVTEIEGGHRLVLRSGDLAKARRLIGEGQPPQ